MRTRGARGYVPSCDIDADPCVACSTHMINAGSQYGTSRINATWKQPPSSSVSPFVSMSTPAQSPANSVVRPPHVTMPTSAPSATPFCRKRNERPSVFVVPLDLPLALSPHVVAYTRKDAPSTCAGRTMKD